MAVEVHGSTKIHAPVKPVWDYITKTDEGPLAELLGGQPVTFEPASKRMVAGMKASTTIEVANFLNLGRDEKFPLVVHIEDVNHDDYSFTTAIGGYKFLRGSALVRLIPHWSDETKTEMLFRFRLPIIALVVKPQIQAGVHEAMPNVGKIISKRFRT